MKYVILALLYLLVPMTLCLVDRRIKGCRSVLFKIVSMVTVMTFLWLAVYFYGQQILATFRINARSFTSAKAFFNSGVLVLLGLLIFFLLVVCKFVFFRLTFKQMGRTFTKSEKAFTLVTVFFDLALVPNIFVNHSLFAVFSIVALVEIGLVYTKLVFSIAQMKNEEVLA